MRQETKINHALVSHQDRDVIIIDKDGLRLESGKDYNLDAMVREAIRRVIDTPAWSHSWHVSISDAKYKHRPQRRQVRAHINERIKALEVELQEAKNARQILSRWR